MPGCHVLRRSESVGLDSGAGADPSRRQASTLVADRIPRDYTRLHPDNGEF